MAAYGRLLTIVRLSIGRLRNKASFKRRYTKRTDRIQCSFEDGQLKQRGLELVLAA